MKYFTTLDQANAYHAIPIAEDDKKKAAFSTPSGLYEFNYLPFGLCNAPASFQRLMDILLSGVLVYLDDILIYAKTYDQMLQRLTSIPDKLDKGGMKLKLSKCKFFQSEVTYPGHQITENGIRPDPEKLKAIKLLPTPKKTKDIKSFLGLISYYRKFIPNCSKLAYPLNKLLKKDEKFVWTTEQQHAFDDLKQKLQNPTLLVHPDFNKQFILQTDASVDGIGAVLSQIGSDDQEHPIAYASRSLKSAERNYPITELESLAVMEFVKYFRPYLYQQEVVVETDNTAVQSVLTKSNPSPRIPRWGLALAGIKLHIKPRKGTTNQNADALSRLPNPIEKARFSIDDLPPATVYSIMDMTADTLVDHQHREDRLLNIIHDFENIDDSPYNEKFIMKNDLAQKDKIWRQDCDPYNRCTKYFDSLPRRRVKWTFWIQENIRFYSTTILLERNARRHKEILQNL